MTQKASCTIASVARKAGVATGTVSRVLNHAATVKPEHRKAVERAIAELGYRPDQRARALRRTSQGQPDATRTGNVAIVFLNTTSQMLKTPLLSLMVHGIQQELSRQGYHMMIDHTEDTFSMPATVRDGKVEGIIAHGDMTLELGERLGRLSPMVVIGTKTPGLSLHSVNIDNVNSMASAVRHLYEQGHRRIGFACHGPEFADFAERLEGYRRALKAFGLEARPEWEFTCPSPSSVEPVTPEPRPPNMSALLAPLASLAERPTALLVANDWQAVGVYRALNGLGMRIPQDISVIGFDNDVRLCQAMTPPLTSLEYPAEELGRTAARQLLQECKQSGDTLREMVSLQPALQVRDSCAVPAAVAATGKEGSHGH